MTPRRVVLASSARYLADEAKTTRRGVIAQELEKIDPQYVHSAEESGKMTLDLNPLMLDALAAIKALAVFLSNDAAASRFGFICEVVEGLKVHCHYVGQRHF